MARVCQVTGKIPMVGNNVSHANNKTRATVHAEPAAAEVLGRERKPLGQPAAHQRALRTIDKKGIDVVLAELRARGEHV